MPSYLESLPNELLSSVSGHLSYVDKTALGWTCKQMWSRVRLPKFSSMSDLLEIEQDYVTPHQSKAGLDLLACRLCLELRPTSGFSNAMTTGPRANWPHSWNDERSKRFCIPCGVKSGLYKPGLLMRYGTSRSAGGGVGIVCKKCKRFGPAACTSRDTGFCFRRTAEEEKEKQQCEEKEEEDLQNSDALVMLSWYVERKPSIRRLSKSSLARSIR